MITITISEMLDKVLNDLGSIGGIQASALVTNNGILMASDISFNSVDDETIGAIVAMLSRSAIHTAKELKKGDVEYLLLAAKYGQIIIIQVDLNVILTVLTDENANIISTIMEMRNSCEKIREIFSRI